MAGAPPAGYLTDNQKRRKRDADDHAGPASHSGRIPQPPPPQAGTGTPIDYLSRASESKLRLFPSDNEAFTDMSALISEYGAVLTRHESLAVNLGAKLTAPRLLRAMESLFEGGITVSPMGPEAVASTSWLKIASFATSNPAEFSMASLTTTDAGLRVCRFHMNNLRVEISEEDWRTIRSGALDHFRLLFPPQPLEQDEAAELATLDIVDTRLQKLIRDADEVARKARHLIYRLSGRKAAIEKHCSSAHNPNTHSHPTGSLPPQAPAGLDPTYDLRVDLLEQFTGPVYNPTAPVPAHHQPSIIPVPALAEQAGPPIPTPGGPSIPQTHAHALTPTRKPSPTPFSDSPMPRPSLTTDESQEPYRSVIQGQIEKLAQGDKLVPPCDYCRRLNEECIKYKTSCRRCKNKHQRCYWRSVTDAESRMLMREMAEMDKAAYSGDLCESGEAEVDVDTDMETQEAIGKETPPSSASSSRSHQVERIGSGQDKG